MNVRGFTFIEVLFALFIAALLGITAGYTLILALRAEARGRALQEATLIVSSVHAAERMGLTPDDSAAAQPAGWRVEREQADDAATGTEPAWLLHDIREDDADFRAVIAFRAEQQD